jgi:hypothetical protein
VRLRRELSDRLPASAVDDVMYNQRLQRGLAGALAKADRSRQGRRRDFKVGALGPFYSTSYLKDNPTRAR